MATLQPDVDTYDTFRCSFGQQSLWLIDQLSPGSAAYNIHAAVRSPLALEPAHLSAAAAALTARHETLRTVFHWEGYEPAQRILAHCPPCLRLADLRSLSLDLAEQELARLSSEDAAAPFDLGRAPLLRLGLVQMPQGRSVLLVTIHHIVADAWSLNILLRDLLELYVARATGRRAQLPELPIQYADFAEWQRDLLDEDRKAGLVAGWRAFLAGAGQLHLPTDRPRGRARTDHGGQHRFTLPANVSSLCLQRSREFASTPYALVTACFAEVLYRYCGCDDFMIGMPTAGRSRPDLEDLIGYFVRTPVLRIDLTGTPSFRELTRRVSDNIGKALELQDLPFESVVELVEPGRELAVNPLFQVTSQFLASPLERTGGGGSLDVVDLHRGFANFDLTLDFWEEDDVIAGRIEYARDLYEPDTVTRLAGHLSTLLASALNVPDSPIAELEMLTAAERRQLLDEWAKGPDLFPHDASLPQLFAEIVAAHPERPAIRDASGDLTYAQLASEAGALATRLVQAGVASGDCIGVCLPRGRYQIIAALGIVLAGGAYVALDPCWPEGRVAGMIGAARIRFAVVDDEAGRWEALGLQVLSASDPAIAGVDLPQTTADDIAYVAFTSGSTGEPKGVPARHRGVVRLMRGGPPISFAPDDTMLAFAPLGFDASTLEIWGPLLNGACIAVAPEGRLSPHELADFMERAGVTQAWLTAGLFSQMSETRPATLAGLRSCFAGGDALPEPAVRRVLEAGGTVVNGYGPTENTVFTCCSVMQDVDALAAGIRIGRPVSGTYAHVLDPLDRPVPIGVPGELIAGGAGVSPGYLHDPAGSPRFTPDPIDPAAGQVYRTGDLVRWTRDGEIEFLGRRDRQVKVRGFRIELGEVESAILREPQVRGCAVAVRGTGADDKALAAFVVLDEASGGVAALWKALAKRLPAHALPSSITAVSEMPLGETGKVDVTALLALPAAAEPDDEGTGALTELEDLIAETFAAVLGRGPIAVDRPFFELGGHSLHATRVVTRLRDVLAIELPLQAIFESPTVRGLAARVEEILLAEFEPAAEGAL